jgi:short-subunit dehydrogenase
MEQVTKWAVVTGGSKGIGRAIVEAFLSDGFNIVTCARNAGELAKLKTEMEAKHIGLYVSFVVADLSKKTDCEAFGQFVLQKTDSVDVLVNNAGYFLPGQIHNEPEGTLESMMQTNVYSAYYVTRVVLPLMMTRKRGHVFTICSTASIMPYVNGGSYCISKHALLGFSKVLREEMKPHQIRVTSVLPGATLTTSWEGVDLPKERFMKPEDVASAILACWKLSGQTVVEELLLRPQFGDI